MSDSSRNASVETTVISMTDPNSAKPVPDLWFTTSNMVVVQSGTKEFRVPQCILTARSRVLKDKILLERASGPSNAPILRLPDTPTHMEYFLRAIYDSGYFEPPPTRCQLEQVVGILHLSSKYEVGYLRRRALIHLESGYPFTLDGLRRRPDTATFLPITEHSIPYATVNIPKTLSVIRALYEVGAVWLLPAAFYECGRYELTDLINHRAWVDGFGSNNLNNCALKNTILIGYVKQSQATARVLHFLHGRPGRECSQPSVCSDVLGTRAGEVFYSWAVNNPLGMWDEEDWQLLEDMCEACLAAAKANHAKECYDLWKRLPEMYSLSPWERLLDLRASSLSA